MRAFGAARTVPLFSTVDEVSRGHGEGDGSGSSRRTAESLTTAGTAGVRPVPRWRRR